MQIAPNESAPPTNEALALDVANTPIPLDEGIMPIIQHVWNYKLFNVNETTITVSQLVIALLVLVFGVLLAKVIARRVGQRILPKLKVESGPAAAIQTILYYILVTIAVVMSLQIAGVPLTIFTIFGGALALGIGFGSQNLIANFISGLLVMLERPVRLGDLISIGGDTGVVRKIGARSTHIHGYDGATFIVPNSTLLENTITNWNLPDRAVRSRVAVGVAYGSDTSKVREILEQAINEHERVIRNMDNRVLFREFADSSLAFEIHFWTHPRSSLDKNSIESDMRFAIDALCREHDITIAFPQLDVHLDAVAPIDIRMHPTRQD
ncbi:MAG: mechanosensitive ion channel [Phycisphaerales bacterium]|nr:mechanosensitive ion channel [Phycisphaerales bacterium]